MRQKVLILIISVLLNSCGFFELLGLRGEGAMYVISNSSIYDIRIEAYRNNILIDSFNINKGQDTISVENFRSSPERYNFFIEVPDSVIVRFENSRFLKQYCSGNPLNIGETECSSIVKNISAMYYRSPRIEIAERYKGTRVTEKYIIDFDNSDYERSIPL